MANFRMRVDEDYDERATPKPDEPQTPPTSGIPAGVGALTFAVLAAFIFGVLIAVAVNR